MKVLIVVLLFAVVTYLLVRLVQERGLPGSSGSGGGRGNIPGRPKGPQGPRKPRPTAPPAPRGPDDDDDFLRELDRKRRAERDDSDS